MRVEWLIPFFYVLTSARSRWLFVGAETSDGDGQEAVILSFPRDVPEEGRAEALRSAKKLIGETSQFLNASTGLFIPEVVFLIPESWNITTDAWSEFGNVSYPTSSEKLSDAQILVQREGPYRNQPVATQHRTCGAQGRHVILPLEILEDKEIPHKAKLLAREWIKYRYGVFDENGYYEDSRFPKYYKVPGSPEDEVQINGCSNVPINYTFQDLEGYNCSLEVDSSSGLPIDNSTCFVHVTPEVNQEVRSSFMDKDLESLPNVDSVCGNDQHPHNSNAPNKQNTFCRGLSILEVMKQHKDFENKMNEKGYLEPIFRLVKQPNLRIVVAVDDTSGLASIKDLLKNSLDIFTHLLPNTSEFGVLKFKDANPVTELVSLTRLDKINEDRDASIARNIQFLFRENIASKPELAIQHAAKILVPDDIPRSGTIIIIAATDPGDLDVDSTKLFNSLCLIAIVIHESHLESFEKFIKTHKFDQKCSKIFMISEMDFSALEKMNEALNVAIDRSDYQNENILIKGAELTSELPLSLVIDSSVSSFDILLTSDMPLNIDEEYFQFTESETTHEFKKISSSNRNVLLFRVQEPKAGKWECKLTAKGDKLLATVKTRLKDESPLLRLNAWIEEAEPIKDGSQSPIILYAEVFSGDYPIIDASVTARITSPDGNITVFQLFDNGLGDPDITQNDGIYTRYFTQFTAVGDYKVSVTADDNGGSATIRNETDLSSCCGSEIKYTDVKPTDMFKMTDDAEFTTTYEKTQNGFEPSQVLDLRITEISTSLVFSLQWTAPGNEKDQDTAKEYHLKVFKTEKDARDSFDSEDAHVQAFSPEKLISPSPYGTLQNVSICINDSIPKDVTYYISLRTISENGIASKVSNVVQLFVSSELSIGTNDPESTTISGIDSVRESAMPRSHAIAIAVGAFVLVAILVVVGYVSFHCYSKRKVQKKKDVETNNTSGLNDHTEPANRTDGSVTANEWKLDQDPISPVNSVPAKVLLYHHEQVKDAKMKNVEPPLFTLENLRNTDTANAEEHVIKEDIPEVVAEPNELENGTSQVNQNADQLSNAKSKRRTTNV